MPNPFFSAFLPSLTQSLTGGAVGALQGQMQGQDRQLQNELLRAQADLAKAHAFHYTHQQKAAQLALDQFQKGMAADPNFMNTPAGRAYAFGAFKFDPYLNDWRAYAAQQQGNMSGAHGDLFEQQGLTDSAKRQPQVSALENLAGQRKSQAGLFDTRAADITATQPSRIGLNQAKIKSEGALQNLRAWQANLAKEKAELQKQLTKAGQGGKALNLFSLANMLNDRINGALERGEDPNPNDVLLYEDVRTKIAGPEFTPIPLGSPGMGSKLTGQPVQPEVPAQPGGLISKPTPGIPGTAPARKPLNLTPKPKTSGRPGAQEHEQAILKARKLITERGQKFAEEQLKSNKALTPTEKLALKEALLLEAGQR